jgi:branched-subunit amino acid aminotransferase/4-amino-4-deoxychorismate lyase
MTVSVRRGPELLVWSAGAGTFVADTRDGRPAPAVIDSWLVANGRARAVDRHCARFRQACQRVAPESGAPDRFLRAAIARIPQDGRWFPRVELARQPDDFEFRLWIRPAPAEQAWVRLWVPDGPDRRLFPAVKGPDLDYLGGLRDRAHAVGADEALLLSTTGEVLEGATTSLLWWRDGVLCGPPRSGAVLPSVTRSVVEDRARAVGVETRDEMCALRDLDGLEIWAVNALHGIRPVTAVLGAAVRPGPPERGLAWTAWLAGPATNEGG